MKAQIDKPKAVPHRASIHNVLKQVTVEPLMFLYGFAFSITSVFVEDLQMRRICEVGLEQNSSVCASLSNHPNISNTVQIEFSVFAFYDGIIKSAIPLFFILFMGAWSDKYGRKVPLYTAEFGHFLNFLGLLLFSISRTLPVHYMLIPSLLDSLGGGNICFLTASNAYISDITSESSRTSRVGVANSLFFLGGPLGTFTGKFIYDFGGYEAIFSTSLAISVISLLYIKIHVEESHGPYVSKTIPSNKNKEKLAIRASVAQIYGIESKKTHKIINIEDITLKRMVIDFFSPKRIIESFKCTLKKREGNIRFLIGLVITCCLVQRLTRSPYMFAFTRHVLSWEASDYSLWVTYKNLLATTGSLFAVPFLSGRLKMSDYILGMIGAISGMLEYLVYGGAMFIGEYLFWIGPLFALLVNACAIAQRAMISKFVSADELGKVSAVLGALDGIMPMVKFALFMAVYRETVVSFPAAHFFVGVCCSAIMVLIFLIIMSMDKSQVYDIESIEEVSKPKDPVIMKRLIIRKDSRWFATDFLSMSITNSVLESRNVDANDNDMPRKGSIYHISSGKSSTEPLSLSIKLHESIPEEDSFGDNKLKDHTKLSRSKSIHM